MRATSEITNELIASGLTPAQTALLMELVLSLSCAPGAANPVESPGYRTLEKRRAWDRDRKRLQRGLRLPDSEWYPLVGIVLKRDGYKCTYCGSIENLTADHVVPLTRGGSNDPSNLTACCIPCNTKKSNRLVSEWLPNSITLFHADVVHPIPPDSTRQDKSDCEVEEKKEGLSVGKERKKGSRLSKDARASDADREFAIGCGCPPDKVDEIWTEFVDYWIGVPGARGCKLDWSATWRNRVRDVVSRKYRGRHGRINETRADTPAGRATAREAEFVAAVGGGALRILEEERAARSAGQAQGGSDFAGQSSPRGRAESAG